MISLRPMVVADLDTVMSLESELFPQDAWTRDLFIGELEEVPNTRRVMVACDGNIVVGYVSLRLVPPEADINTIAVGINHQGKGIATQMMDWIISEARKYSIRDIFLDVRSDNFAAIAMYDKFGFVRIDKRANYYGNNLDALVMRKRLTHE